MPDRFQQKLDACIRFGCLRSIEPLVCLVEGRDRHVDQCELSDGAMVTGWIEETFSGKLLQSDFSSGINSA
jgi:hypothetical protein